jgi:Lar family restriction alleviation protein
MERTNLKPCPFCGCEDISLFYYDPYDGYQGDYCGVYKVRCSQCGCTLQNRDKTTAAKMWNTRFNNNKEN